MVGPAGTHIVVVGNEKGGAGKTTAAMHLAVALMRMGYPVGTIDLDPRQRTLTRYVENRSRWMEENPVRLPRPEHRLVIRSTLDSIQDAARDEEDRLAATVEELGRTCPFLVVDCPGNDVPLARFAHTFADTLITPINDSLVDLDLLVELHPTTLALERPGVYAAMILEQRRARLGGWRRGCDWILLRNRLSALNDHNKRRVLATLESLSKTLGFRMVRGFGERIVFRQLFLAGLTVLDLREPGTGIPLTMSHVAARQEVRQLVEALWLPRLEGKLDMI
ncbi:MAG: division plane positioning ATPase MipZ [Magnetospirillum sp. WYHS-4]